jgi:hypothetical protein
MKLIYFDFGGRGEPIRLAFRIGDVAFEDDRIAPSDWPGRKAEMPLGAMPVLEVNGTRLVH